MSFLSAEAINEYIEIYREEFGKDISFDEAQKQAENFLKLVSLICGLSNPVKKLI